MSNLSPLDNTEFAQKKGFFKRPEGVLGAVVLAAIAAGIGYLVISLPWAVILTPAIPATIWRLKTSPVLKNGDTTLIRC